MNIASHRKTAAYAESPAVEILAEVTVSAATAIITPLRDPTRVLIGDSEKHTLPVLPGGKLEAADISAEGPPGLRCVVREVQEEIGAKLRNARLVAIATDPDRDIRLVKPSRLAGALVSPPLALHLPDSVCVKAHYGCPDYIFVGSVREEDIKPSEELKNPRFVPISSLDAGSLSAGHDVLVLWYRIMLEQKAAAFPPGTLANFLLERDRLCGV